MLKRTPLRRGTKGLKRTPLKRGNVGLRRVSKNRIPTLRRKAWGLMSEFVRRRDRGICFTCGIKKNWEEQQAGHFIHRDHLDFNFVNINCQCPRCNKFLSGNLDVYAEKLIAKYGELEFMKLCALRHKVVPWRVSDLENIIGNIKVKIGLLIEF